MKKLCRDIFLCMLLAVCFWAGAFLADRQKMREELIRFHVVAASDTEEDQKRKLSVRDAVRKSMEAELASFSDAKQAARYLQEKIPCIEQIAEDTVQKLDGTDPVTVTLRKELFGKQSTDAFSLPAGWYQTLRIVIGQGMGQNWWGVVFPEAVPALQPVFSAEKQAEPRLGLLIRDVLDRLGNILFSR